MSILIKNAQVLPMTAEEIICGDILIAGDKIAVIGEEGNGKSTLFKAIWNPDLISEYTVMEGTIDRRGAVIGYLPQSLDARWVETSGLGLCMSETPAEIPEY